MLFPRPLRPPSEFLILLSLALSWACPVAVASPMPPEPEPIEKATETSEALVGWVEPANAAQRRALRDRVDVWTRRPADDGAGERWLVVASPAERRWLAQTGLDFVVDESHTGRLRELDAARSRYADTARASPTGTRGVAGYPCYRTVDETYSDLAGVAQSHPEIAQWVDFGDSWLETENGTGDDLRALVLGNQSIAGKSPFVLIAAMHPREMTTAETATRFAEYLVSGYGVDPDISWILDHVEVHIVPLLNPDGRRQAEGLVSWRKNVDNDFCSNTNSRGVDLNRNSSWFWAGPDGSSVECADTYRGDAVASEPETAAIESYLAQVLPDQWSLVLAGGELPPDPDPPPEDAQGVFVSLHSFGGQVLYPWEGSTTIAPNLSQLVTLGRKFGYYLDYRVCDSCLTPAGGTTVDVAYGEYGVASYTFELGTTFFESCSSFEQTIWPAARDALLFGARVAPRPYRWPAGPELYDLGLSSGTVIPGVAVVVSGAASDERFDSNGYGTEASQSVAAGYYAIDADPLDSGLPMAALDGSFDQVVEGLTATIDTTGLEDGLHRVVVRAEDSAGNLGPPRVVWLEVAGTVFSDDFESGDFDAWSVSPARVP